MEQAQLLEKMAEEIKGCTKCPLCKSRTNAVPGSGNYSVKIMFIGEAPGKVEDELGEPFVGWAGKFLYELIASVGLSREEIFITNIVKCRPPENRVPKPDEIATCTNNYLKSQIELISPKLIVTLGLTSARFFNPKINQLKEVHGSAFELESKRIIFLYHPALALFRPDLAAEMKADFQKITQF